MGNSEWTTPFWGFALKRSSGFALYLHFRASCSWGFKYLTRSYCNNRRANWVSTFVSSEIHRASSRKMRRPSQLAKNVHPGDSIREVRVEGLGFKHICHKGISWYLAQGSSNIWILIFSFGKWNVLRKYGEIWSGLFLFRLVLKRSFGFARYLHGRASCSLGLSIWVKAFAITLNSGREKACAQCFSTSVPGKSHIISSR